MPGLAIPNTKQNLLFTDFWGENLSVTVFGAVGDGITDDGPAFNLAIQTAVSLGGRGIKVPSGKVYNIMTPIIFPSGVCNVYFFGDGEPSIIQRGADMPDGQGMIDIQGATGVAFENLVFEGNKLAHTGILYSAVSSPLDTALTKNSTVWIHGGSAKVRFRNITIRHTAGYSIIGDSTSTGDINDLRLLDSTIENCRSHFAGSQAGDLNYGFWNSGVLLIGGGASGYVCRNVLAKGNFFSRIAGNAFWTHVVDLTKSHSNIKFNGNTVEDTGLDGVQYAGVTGGSVDSNQFRRIGYICDDSNPATADTVASYPRWLNAAGYNIPAVAIDTAGRVRGVSYNNNTVVSANGGALDLDGFGEGTANSNTVIVPLAGEPEYTEDNIAHCGPAGNGQNWMYGINFNNSNNDSIAASRVEIASNNFKNIGGGAIKLYSARSCNVHGNHISHPDNPGVGYVPIVLGNIGTGQYQRCYNNLVHHNHIEYSPTDVSGNPLYEAVVYEDDTISFQPGDTNYVYDNAIDGNGFAFEFAKAPSSGSTAGRRYSSAATIIVAGSPAHLNIISENIVQREAGYLRWYTVLNQVISGVNTPVSTPVMTLLDKVDLGGGNFGGPLLNVAKGASNTGVISTGNRVTAAVDDIVQSGKLYADSFLVLTDSTAVKDISGNFTEADRFNTSAYCLLRYDSVAKIPYISTDVSGGHRVWSIFGGGIPGGPNMSVQFNDAGASNGVADFLFNKTTKVLSLKNGAAIGTHLFTVGSSGYLSFNAVYDGTNATLDNSALSGLYTQFTPGASAAATAISYLYTAPSGTSVSRIGQMNGLGNWGLGSVGPSTTAGVYLTIVGVSGVPAINIGTAGYIASQDGFQTGSASSLAVYAPNGGITGGLGDFNFNAVANNAYNVLTVHTGGISVTGYTTTTGDALTAFESAHASSARSSIKLGVPSSGSGGWQFGQDYNANNTKDFFIYDINSTALRLHIGVNGNVGVNQAAAVTTGQVLQVAGIAGQATISNTGAGYIQSVDGYLTNAATYQAYSAPSGGYFGKTTNVTLYSAWSANPSAPAMPFGSIGTSQGALSFNSGSVYWYWNATTLSWALVDFAAIGSSTPAGVGGAVQYNNFGVLGGDSKFIWSPSSGFLQIIAGGSPNYYALRCVDAAVTYSFYVRMTDIAGSGSAVTTLYNNASIPMAFGIWNAEAFRIDASRRVIIGGTTAVASSAKLEVQGTAGSVSFNVTGGYIQSAQGFYTPLASGNAVQAPNGGFTGLSVTATSTSYQAIQAPNGGVQARSCFSQVYTQLGSSAGLPTATAGDSLTTSGCIYWDRSLGTLRVYNGSAWVSLGSSTPGGSSGQLQVNNAGAFAGFAGLTWSGTTLTITGSTGAALAVSGGYIQVDYHGLLINDTAGLNAYNAIHVLYGGISCGNGSNGGFYVGTTKVIDNSANLSVNGITAVSAVLSGGITATAFNPPGKTGQTYDVALLGGVHFSVNGSGSFTTLHYTGGVITSVS